MTRKKKLFLNSTISFLYQVTAFVCGFILPKMFLKYYGSEVNGLVSSITNFLGFITLAECGVGAVVQSAYYKPLADQDDVEISKVYASSEKFFHIIAYILLAYTALLFFGYPLIVKDSFAYLYTAILILVMSISYFAQYYIGMSYKLLLNAAGVCCERVSGSATANEITGHAWNVVMLNAHDDDPSNDRCYYVDTTWDDNANGYGYDNFMRSVDNDFPDHSTKYCNWEIEGNFNEIELTSIPEKSYSIWTIGDINGDSYVTGADLFILREYENSNDWTDDMRANADVNFDGIINENDVEILSFFIDARLGDINNSGNIDEYDYLSLKHYLERPQDIGSYMKVSADVNMDGSYDDRDLEALKSLFGRSCEKVNYYFNQYCFEKIQQKIK